MKVARAFEEPKRVCCAVTNCRTAVARGKMMCLTHWMLVPEALKIEIGHTYRSRQMGNYQDAYRRAVDHVESATAVLTGIFEKRATCDPARREGGGSRPITLPSRPHKARVRRPRLTVQRLVAIELALQSAKNSQDDIVTVALGDLDGALLWVRGERAKRRARKVARA